MAKSGNPIAEALGRAQAVSEENGSSPIIRSDQMSRADREILVRSNWLQSVTRGWYMLVRPDLPKGDSSAWYAHFWDFLATYLKHHYGESYCLTAEASLALRLGIRTVPEQVVVMAETGRGKPTELPFDTSVYIYQNHGPLPEDRSELWGLQVLELPYALCKVSPNYFTQHSHEVELALAMLSPPEELARCIAKHDFRKAAARVAGAFQAFSNEKAAALLIDQLKDAGIFVSPRNPFSEIQPKTVNTRVRSPYCGRIQSMWTQMRGAVIELMPEAPGLAANPTAYLESVHAEYVKDAYHSLSIEGYHVTKALVEKVRNAGWDPEGNSEDAQQRDAMAARGYYEAFQATEDSISKILAGQNPGEVVSTDLSLWYRKLFAPSVRAGLLRDHDLFGYRRSQVYIRGSRHTPLPCEALPDAMDSFFGLLIDEKNPAVRAVLGHFLFVFIHPYMDGNGRLARFLLNSMLASGGYPWLVIRVEERGRYFAALETASVDGDIRPFASFLANLLNHTEH